MAISKNIKGYEMVANVTKCRGFERCGYTHYFVVRRKNDGNYLSALVEVAPITEGSRERLNAEYPHEDYIIWGGTIVGNEIHFYWS